eukprot:g11799.t1
MKHRRSMLESVTTAAVVVAACGVVCFPSVARAASAGDSHSCVLLEGGSVKCWGEAVKGQLGQEDGIARGGNATDLLGDTLPAVPLGDGFEATTVVSGNEFSCAVSVLKAVKCWGMNQAGQLGQGDTEQRGGPNGGVFEMGDNLAPVDILGESGVADGMEVESIALGGSSACAVISGGLLKCWGLGEGGQLGLGDTFNRGNSPGQMGDFLPTVDLGSGAVVTSVAVGNRHACAVIAEGRVKCWGNNDGGQLGYEDRNPRGSGLFPMGNSLPFVDLGTGQQAIAVAAGHFHTCALLYTGDVKCWGFGASGQLGQGTNSSIGDAEGTMGDNLPAINLGTGRTAVAISLGGAHTCAVLDDDTVKCWGGNDLGSLGLGDIINRGAMSGEMGDNLPPVALSFGEGGGSVSNVYAGTLHTCVSGTEGGLACFGFNHQGQLGASTIENLGDDPGEVEALTAIDVGGTVVAPVSPGFRFNNPTEAPAPSPRDISTDGGDDAGSTAIIAASVSVGIVLCFLLLGGVCCCRVRRRKEERQLEARRAAAAIYSMEGGDAGSKTKGDDGRRVQFSGDLKPESIDDHPLLKGVNLDATTFVSPEVVNLDETKEPSGSLAAPQAVATAGAAATTTTVVAPQAAAARSSSVSSMGSSSVEAKDLTAGSKSKSATSGAGARGSFPVVAAPTVMGPAGLAEGPAQVGDAGGYVLVEGRTIPPPSKAKAPKPDAVVDQSVAASQDSGSVSSAAATDGRSS